jgi:hypothetical protein
MLLLETPLNASLPLVTMVGLQHSGLAKILFQGLLLLQTSHASSFLIVFIDLYFFYHQPWKSTCCLVTRGG